MKKKYGVTLPVTGLIYVEVEADDEKSAIEAALGADGLTNSMIEEWEAHREVNRGNVWHGPIGEASAEEIDG